MTTHLSTKSYFLSTTDPVECSFLIIRDSSGALILSTHPFLIKHPKVRWYWHIISHHFNGSSPSTLTQHIHYTDQIIVITCAKNNCVLLGFGSHHFLSALVLTKEQKVWRTNRQQPNKWTGLLGWQLSLVFVNCVLTLSGQVQFELR